MEWVEQYLKTPPMVIFDVGSNRGADGIAFKRRFESAKVISIEADPKLYKRIEDKYKKLRLNDIYIFNCAVCDYDGDIDFYSVINTHVGAGSIHKPLERLLKRYNMEFNQPIKVPCTRLDTFCSKNFVSNIDIIHMDIQSAEYRALIGLGTLRPKMIFLEISLENKKYYENSDVSTSKKLIEMGYELKEKIAGDALWIHKTQ